MANYADKAAGKNAVGTFGAYVARIFTENDRDPTVYDWQGYNLMDGWLNKITKQPWILVSLDGDSMSRGPQALWIKFGGSLDSLTGNTGGPVFADANDNINIVGDGVFLIVTGTPLNNTLTISPVGGSLVLSVTAGENLNNSGTASAAVINLDRIIRWPNTTSDGLQGAIYLGATCVANECTGGTLFMHNFGSVNTFLGSGAGNLTTTGTGRNVGIGAISLASLTTGSANTAVGYDSLNLNSNGNNNTAIGHASMPVVTTSSTNTAVGANSLQMLTTGNGSNVAVGVQALQQILTGFDNTAVGTNAGDALTSTESRNVIIGAQNTGIATEQGVVRIGAVNASLSTTGSVFVGYDAGNLTLTVGSATANVGVGALAANGLTTGSGNTLVGNAAGLSITTGTRNCGFGGNVFGPAIGVGITTGSNNCGFGAQVLQSLVSGTDNVSMGDSSGSLYASNESYNINIGSGTQGKATELGVVRIGSQVGSSNNFNTFVGQFAGNNGYTLPAAVSNTCVGYNSGHSITTASGLTAFGSQAGASITSGTDNVAIGFAALVRATTGAANAGANTAVGTGSLQFVTTGIQNIGIGDNAGSNGVTGVTTGSYNTFVGGNGTGGSYTGAESSNLLLNANGVVGESNVIRIGQQGGGNDQQNKCWIAGIRGVTTGVANAIAVLIDSTGQLGTISSSARYKENILDMGQDSSFIYRLRPVIFNYKKDASKSKQWGLIAEEVAVAEPRLAVYDSEGIPETVKYHDLVPILLNELQKLNKTVCRNEIQISELLYRVQLLEAK